GLAEQHVATDLLPRIKALAPATPQQLAVSAPAPSPATRVRAATGRVEVVVIAASTGGPNALAEVIPALGPDVLTPVLVVQHMPAVFTTMLAQRLDREASVPVAEASAGEPVVAGRVYVAPGGRHLAVARASDAVHVALQDSRPENSCRPAADVLFRSAAA